MKKISALFLAATLALTTVTPAQADWGHRHHGGHGGHFQHHHRSSHGWVGPAAVLAIAGLAIGTAVASQNQYVAPAPVYSAPPRPMLSADYGTWYYCSSSGQYYPYTNACPEGWQAVPAR